MTNSTPRTFPELLDADFAGTMLAFMRAFEKDRDELEARDAAVCDEAEAQEVQL